MAVAEHFAPRVAGREDGFEERQDEGVDLTSVMYSDMDSSWGRAMYHPTDPGPGMEKAAQSYGRAMSGEPGDPDLMRSVSDMHWWFANSMPFCRGSAAVGEWLAQSVIEKKTGMRPEFEGDVSPDLAAFMAEDRDAYAAQYGGMLVMPDVAGAAAAAPAPASAAPEVPAEHP